MRSKEEGKIDVRREKRLQEAMRKHPELMERFEAILGIAEEEGGRLNADEVEERLIEEVRKLGQRTLESWADGAQERGVEELREAKPGARLRKKNG